MYYIQMPPLVYPIFYRILPRIDFYACILFPPAPLRYTYDISLYFYYLSCHPTINVQHDLQRGSLITSPKEENPDLILIVNIPKTQQTNAHDCLEGEIFEVVLVYFQRSVASLYHPYYAASNGATGYRLSRGMENSVPWTGNQFPVGDLQ